MSKNFKSFSNKSYVPKSKSYMKVPFKGTKSFKRQNIRNLKSTQFFLKRSNSDKSGKSFPLHRNFSPGFSLKRPVITKQFNLCLWIRQTYNNIFLTVTNSSGRVCFVVSGGFSKLRGNNRVSHRSIEIIMKILLKRLARIKIRKLEFKTLCIFLVTPKNSTIKSLLGLFAGVPKVCLIAARLRIPHNGIRLKKLRRLLVYLFISDVM